jgi:hypothetical protein
LSGRRIPAVAAPRKFLQSGTADVALLARPCDHPARPQKAGLESMTELSE